MNSERQNVPLYSHVQAPLICILEFTKNANSQQEVIEIMLYYDTVLPSVKRFQSSISRSCSFLGYVNLMTLNVKDFQKTTRRIERDHEDMSNQIDPSELTGFVFLL